MKDKLLAVSDVEIRPTTTGDPVRVAPIPDAIMVAIMVYHIPFSFITPAKLDFITIL
jgi:hypothetical protein